MKCKKILQEYLLESLGIKIYTAICSISKTIIDNYLHILDDLIHVPERKKAKPTLSSDNNPL
jgi:hypothetical protein